MRIIVVTKNEKTHDFNNVMDFDCSGGKLWIQYVYNDKVFERTYNFDALQYYGVTEG